MPSAPTTLELARAEAWLTAVSTEPAGVAAGISRHAALLGGALVGLEGLVTPGPRLTALERLAIYNDGYFARLVECLRDDYPALEHLLGAAEFERVAREYVASVPSRSPSLNAYGRAMPEWLAGLREPWAPFAAELATLEWALVEVVHAETQPPLDANALSALRPEDVSRARLVASPALRVLSFSHPVNRFYQAFREGSEPPRPARERTAVAVHRRGFSLYRLELTPPMRFLLGELTAGTRLAEAIARLERAFEPDELARVSLELSGWFSAWIASGFFFALELDAA